MFSTHMNVYITQNSPPGGRVSAPYRVALPQDRFAQYLELEALESAAFLVWICYSLWGKISSKVEDNAKIAIIKGRG